MTGFPDPLPSALPALAELDPVGLGQQLIQWGYKPTHAPRILRAFYRGEEIAGTTDCALPAGLVDRLRAELRTTTAFVQARQQAEDGTTKLLHRLQDGRTVESVLMPGFRSDRAAACVSSQVGCAMGCDFCATTRTGFERNLTAGEIIDQFIALRRVAQDSGRKLQTLVFMGMGEPMLNLDAVLTASRRMAENSLGALGWRQITISTVGIVPGMDRLSQTGLNLQLAISLHAPDDATRARLLPTARHFGIDEVLAAADRFHAVRGRMVVLQYCLLAGVNDSPEHAEALAARLKGRRMHVNLLRYHPTGLSLRGIQYSASSEEVGENFAEALARRGVVAHFRRSRGRDIDAACGQLRRRMANQD